MYCVNYKKKKLILYISSLLVLLDLQRLLMGQPAILELASWIKDHLFSLLNLQQIEEAPQPIPKTKESIAQKRAFDQIEKQRIEREREEEEKIKRFEFLKSLLANETEKAESIKGEEKQDESDENDEEESGESEDDEECDENEEEREDFAIQGEQQSEYINSEDETNDASDEENQRESNGLHVLFQKNVIAQQVLQEVKLDKELQPWLFSSTVFEESSDLDNSAVELEAVRESQRILQEYNAIKSNPRFQPMLRTRSRLPAYQSRDRILQVLHESQVSLLE